MSRLRIYTVHINPALLQPYEAAEFIEDGFSWTAFFFTVLWALYHRLWVWAGAVLALNITLIVLTHIGTLTHAGFFALHLGIHLLIGFNANDWIRTDLKKRGYITADIVSGESLLRAGQRFFDRYFATHSIA